MVTSSSGPETLRRIWASHWRHFMRVVCIATQNMTVTVDIAWRAERVIAEHARRTRCTNWNRKGGDVTHVKLVLKIGREVMVPQSVEKSDDAGQDVTTVRQMALIGRGKR